MSAGRVKPHHHRPRLPPVSGVGTALLSITTYIHRPSLLDLRNHAEPASPPSISPTWPLRWVSALPDSGRTETKAKFVNRNFIAPMGVLLKASWGVLRAFWAVSRPSTPLLELCRQRRWRELGGPWARSGVDSSSPTTTATTKIAVIVVECRDCRDTGLGRN